MITFEPDSPWEVGQVVTFREEGRLPYRKVVEAVEHSGDGYEAQYTLVDVDAVLPQACNAMYDGFADKLRDLAADTGKPGGPL